MRFIRILLVPLALVAVSACAPSIPDSGAGVGFGDYDAYQREKAARDAALAGNALPAPDAVSSEPLDGFTPVERGPSATSAADDDLVAQTQAALRGNDEVTGEQIVMASPSNPAPEAVLSPSGISRENDFEAVGSQRSIESDAARIAQNRAQYQVVQPQALPTRSGSGGPNIVDYALRNKHPIGTQVHRRTGFNNSGKYERNCRKYASPDQAQIDFLSKGGPERDKLGLDPDGDGYACAWDPRPYRKAVGG